MRQEYKFLVRRKLLADLRHALLPYLKPDPYALLRDGYEYTVRSIYFDTNELRYYHEKIAGLKSRKKVRIRGYNEYDNSNRIFLEIKRKHENYIKKNRSQIEYRNLDDVFRFVNPLHLFENHQSKNDAKKFLYNVQRYGLNPIVLVVYDREAYYSNFNSTLRITIDKDLRYFGFPECSDLYEDHRLQSALREYVILEVKFTKGFPKWLRSIIQEFGLYREALSKYTICLDAQKHLNPASRKTTLPFSRAMYKSQ